MIETKRIQYKKAYVELYKMLLNLPKSVYEKIPENIIENIKLSGDNSYNWEYDDSKDFETQDIMVETKALFVQIYRNYLMEPTEKEKWEKYDTICKNIVEEEKAKLYDPSKIFETKQVEGTEMVSDTTVSNEANNENIQKQDLMVIDESNIFQKISKIFKEIINKIFRKK